MPGNCAVNKSLPLREGMITEIPVADAFPPVPDRPERTHLGLRNPATRAAAYASSTPQSACRAALMLHRSAFFARHATCRRIAGAAFGRSMKLLRYSLNATNLVGFGSSAIKRIRRKGT